MKFHKLILEGDKDIENKITKDLHINTKNQYLNYKLNKRKIPLYNRSFYICRMIEEELKGIEIDGSGKITVCAYNNHLGSEKYICNKNFNISIYYLEQEEIKTLEEVKPDIEATVICNILKNSLLDIAKQSNCSNIIIQKIEQSFKCIANSNFIRKEHINKLSKHSKRIGLTAHIYRILSAEKGEGWYIEITDKKGTIFCKETIGNNTQYVDRLNSYLYSKSEWRENTFIILDRFCNEVFNIIVPFSFRNL